MGERANGELPALNEAGNRRIGELANKRRFRAGVRFAVSPIRPFPVRSSFDLRANEQSPA
jgi:hypothetical protein